MELLYYLILLLIFIFILDIINSIYKKFYLNRESFKDNTSYIDNIPKLKNYYMDDNAIEISELNDYGKCLIIQDEIQLCENQENIYHEMITHFPVNYLKKSPEYVIIVGGGDLMTLREVMKYKSIKKVIVLELNNTIVELCKKYLNIDTFENNKKVEIIYGDANDTIDELYDDYSKKIDMVIVDSTENNSDNLSIDKPEFFYKCLEIMHKDGILVKNGAYFKSLFHNFDDVYNISYNVDIPYFQEKYIFTIVSKPSHNIEKHKIKKGKIFMRLL